MKRITCAEAKKIDLVQYLSELGFEPVKIRGNDYWFYSPFRQENTPSFKVNRKFNVWYDHGIQKGGNLVDFGLLFHKCSIDELLSKISQRNSLSFHQPFPTKQIVYPGADEKQKIVVLNTRPVIYSASLQDYLLSRKIPLSIANNFCHEVDFQLYYKNYTAIGFPNNAGGYELRNAHFKGSSSPKEVTQIGEDYSSGIFLFEGFFDFLSYLTIQHHKGILLPKQQPNFLILNSIGFIEKMKPTLEKYISAHLYLDRDSKGLSVTKELLSHSNKFQDQSHWYQNHKDLNEYLVKEYFTREQSQRQGRRL
jgi:hypothetical protein